MGLHAVNFFSMWNIRTVSVSSCGMQVSDLTHDAVLSVLQQRDEWLSPQYITTMLLQGKDSYGSMLPYVDRVEFLLDKLPGISYRSGKYRLNQQLFFKVG
ncbi:MAG: hypothetical protein JWM08_103 [Candidatus Angelobacter sp.]|nr:hypothetical protein [Candidatus Angelobacter sp.]